MKSIRGKFLQLNLISIVLCAVLIGGIGLWSLSIIQANTSRDILSLICRAEGETLDDSLGSIQDSVNLFCSMTDSLVPSLDSLQDQDFVDYLFDEAEKHMGLIAKVTHGVCAYYFRTAPELTEKPEGFFYGKRPGTELIEEEPLTDLSIYDPSDTEHVGWYYQPQAAGRPIWMEPYFNQNLGIYMVSYVVPFFRDCVFWAIAGMDIDFDVVIERVQAIHPYTTGYAFLCNDQGVIYYHPQHEPGSRVTDYSSDLISLEDALSAAGDQPVFKYHYNGVGKTSSFYPLQNGMKLILTAPNNEIKAPMVSFEAQRESLRADESFMNVFIAGSDWHIVPGFVPPPGFHASERLWYLGAKDNPGKVYITEPYKDADTGAMCFTVSTLLADGETVVGMDLYFSKVQESILRMTDGSDQAAMIVTAGGLIAGYTDMSLVGESAKEKLPDYAEVLRRVISSRQHDSFRMMLNGKPCMIFSSETSNNWYLILSVDTGTLYAESYSRIAMLAAIDLLMLAVVVFYYMISSRNSLQATEALRENRRIIDGLGEQMRRSVSRILRLSDWQLIRHSEDPAAMIGEIRENGMELNAVADNIQSYSDLLRDQAKREERAKARHGEAAMTNTSSRRVRNWIIVTLLAAMLIVLFLCVHSLSNWGNTRMNREADRYENQLNEWLAKQKSILYMFTDVITSQPQLLDDYDSAVHWLNDIAVRYPDISACYMANPYADPPVIMNNGWIPDENDRPETRPWYRATERSADGFSISAPIRTRRPATTASRCRAWCTARTTNSLVYSASIFSWTS